MQAPLTKPFIEKDLLESIEEIHLEEKQVILHCIIKASPFYGSLIRIWKSSYLIDQKSGRKSELIHAENISLYPYWTEVPAFQSYRFTLVFSGLSSDCELFDFKELIPQSGGFCYKGIRRNKSDVYQIDLSL